MEITIRIDNGDARVFVRQIFANHTGGIEEGNYIFALPSQATVSDFAVWDGPTRIPAVVLERKRAEEIYTQLKQQAIDPGLLQMGERGSEEAKRSSSVQRAHRSDSALRNQAAGDRVSPVHPGRELEILFRNSAPPGRLLRRRWRGICESISNYIQRMRITNFQAPAKVFPLQLDENTPHLVRGHFEGENVNLSRISLPPTISISRR